MARAQQVTFVLAACADIKQRNIELWVVEEVAYQCVHAHATAAVGEPKAVIRRKQHGSHSISFACGSTLAVPSAVVGQRRLPASLKSGSACRFVWIMPIRHLRESIFETPKRLGLGLFTPRDCETICPGGLSQFIHLAVVLNALPSLPGHLATQIEPDDGAPNEPFHSHPDEAYFRQTRN